MKLSKEQFKFRLSKKQIYYDVFVVGLLVTLTFLLLPGAKRIGDGSGLTISVLLAAAGLPAALGFLLAFRYGVIDLSIWAVMGLGGLVAAGLINAGMAPLGAFVLAVGVGAIVGAINGFLICRVRLPAIIITALVGLVLLGAMNWKYSQRTVFVPETTFDNWVSNIHEFFDATNEESEKTSASDEKEEIAVPPSITGPLMVLRTLLVFIAWTAVLLVLGIADNIIPKASHPYKKWWIRPVCICVSGAMAGLSGACWLLDMGHTPVPTRLVDGLTIPVAVILTGTLLLQGRGRTMLAVIFLPVAVLCASIWEQLAYPITIMGYSMGLLILGVIVLTAQWAYIRGIDKTQKARWVYRIACGLELLGLVVLGFAPQLEIDHARAFFLIGVSISAGGLVLISIGVIMGSCRRTDIVNKTYETNSPEETHKLGAKLGTNLKNGDCIALIGNLGAGKTVFVRGLAEGLGCDVRLVSSPTYVLVQEYSCPDDKHIPLYHLDLYRLGDPVEEFSDLGVDEMLSNGIVVIEWADRAAGALPRPYTQISITIDGPTARNWTISRIDN